MTTDDASVDAQRTGRLPDSHTGIPLADTQLLARIHMTSNTSSVRLSCSVWNHYPAIAGKFQNQVM